MTKSATQTEENALLETEYSLQNGDYSATCLQKRIIHCAYCQQPILCRNSNRAFCDKKCTKAYARKLRQLKASGFPEKPTLHLGAFQDFSEAYAGKIDVIITDPPYQRDALPLYSDLCTFAETTLRPGGWLLCLTGWGDIWEIGARFNASTLEYITVCTYLMPGATLTAKIHTSTGQRSFAQQAKPLLWYQKRGKQFHRRRAGTSDLVGNRILGKKVMDRSDFHWQQDLEAFKQIIWTYTNPQDAICDPCMGSGTTLVAAQAYDRNRIVGIEVEYETYKKAVQRLEAVIAAKETLAP